jgi:N-acetylglucosaminyl-diphospho-decaprenol L-rhamnosyltransferase
MENTANIIDLSVIIVSYNTRDYLAVCLKSVMEQQGIAFEVIVVDNNSTDGSNRMVTKEFPGVKLIANSENLGFGQANNQALKICRGRYVYFLNPDTVTEPNCFITMLRFMEDNTGIGLAGTKMLYPDRSFHPSAGDGYPGGRRARKIMPDLPGDIAWVLGASMIAPITVIKAMHGFDERFFLYGEEQDLCLRIRKSGLQIGYITDAVVIHWGGKSERNNLPADVWAKKIRAEYLFYTKHYPDATVRAIRRADCIQAYWRLISIYATLPFSRKKDTLKNKMAKYSQVLKAARSGA